MTVADLIEEAINALIKKGSSKGVSRNAIKAYIGDASTTARINMSLKKGVEAGRLLQNKDSFRLSKAQKEKSKPVKTTKKTTTSTTKKTSTKTTASKAKKTSAKPKTVGDWIKAAITDLHVKGSSKGVSREAIKAYIGDNSTTARINMSLKKAVEAGRLTQVKGSFKIPKSSSSSTAKPKKTTSTKAKKTTTSSKAKKTTTPKKSTTSKAKKPSSSTKGKKATSTKGKKSTSTKGKKASSAKGKKSKK